MKKVFTLLLLTSFALGVFAQKRNMIANSRFEDNYKNWRTDGSPLSNVGTNAIIYDIDSITPISGKKSAKITINAAPSGNVWDRALVYYLPVTKDAQYLVRLKVKASGTNSLFIEYGMNHSGWNQAIVKANYTLTGDGTTVDEIVINAVADVEGTVDPITASCDWQFKFNLGKQPNGAIIWIDDISVTRIDGNWDGNLVPQGDFENVNAGWNGWFDMWNNGICATYDINNENKINGKSLHMVKTSTSTDYKATEFSFFYWENELADYEISGDIMAVDGSTLGSAYFVTFMSNPGGSHLESTPLLAKAVPSSATSVIDHFTINKDNTDSATYHQSSYSSTWKGMIKAYLGFGSSVMPVGYEAYLDNLTVKEKITLKGIEINADSIVTMDKTLGIWATPTHADNSVVWEVINGTGVATIDSNGNLHPVNNGTITVTAVSKVDGSITASKTFSVSMSTVSTSLASSELLKVYPNPTSGTLFIDGNGITGISISTIEGVQLQKLNASGNAVDISQLPSGIYLVKISTASGSFVKPVLKK